MLNVSDVTGFIIDPEKRVKILTDSSLFNTQRLVKFVKFDTLRSKSLKHHFSVLFIENKPDRNSTFITAQLAAPFQTNAILMKRLIEWSSFEFFFIILI